jgi:transposase
MSMQDFKVSFGIISDKMEKKFVSESTFTNTEAGFESFLSWLFKFLRNQNDLYFLMEATGVYHEQLCNYLYDQGLNVSVMPSGRVK